ncbi:MAG: multiphosphoryl transfer protein [Thermoleophilaceae bacterium]|nr:multiphosphoryl transfer protein [Thermoleophilaceae bacterium]
MSERVLSGAPASPGLAIGHARVFSHPSEEPARDSDPTRPGRPPAEEAEHAREALRRAALELERIAAGLRENGRPDEAEIVETGALMAEDPLLESAVVEAVTADGRSAATALVEATDTHAAAIASLPDALLAARADDVRSLGRRAARIAAGVPDEAAHNGSAFVLVAEDLGPAEVAEHGERLVGIALSAGAVTAHAAIVARSLGIPMTVLAGAELLQAAEGAPIVVDGSEGTVVLEPDASRAELARKASDARAQARARERADSALPSVTADGRAVRVLVNAATAAELRAGLAAGAVGAGLIRTELAFLDASGWPSREQHLRMLAPLLGELPGRTATVRVLDFGGDKLPPFLHGEPRRGIELLLAHPGALRAQLAAIAQLAGEAHVRVLLPLVRSAEDVRITRAILGTLGGAGLGAPLQLGAMIEMPEAAAAAPEIAAECDFLSVGTNDLTHATLGTDRFAHGEAPAHDPRVLAHIAATARAARVAGIPLEVCGEAASDPLTVPLLVGLGADELSAGAARVGAVRAWVRALDFREAAELAQRALNAPDAASVSTLKSRPRAAH